MRAWRLTTHKRENDANAVDVETRVVGKVT